MSNDTPINPGHLDCYPPGTYGANVVPLGTPANFRGTDNGPVEPDLHQAGPVEDEPLSPAAQKLYKAALLIDGDRHNQHGERHKNFGTIATFWTVLFGVPVEPWQVARAFELAKIARDINGEPNEDNAIDAAAYSALSWELRG